MIFIDKYNVQSSQRDLDNNEKNLSVFNFSNSLYLISQFKTELKVSKIDLSKKKEIFISRIERCQFFFFQNFLSLDEILRKEI